MIRPTFAANVGGWNLSNAVAQGASTIYDASKNVLINGKNFIKQSSVKITPTASQVSKVLARGAAGYALSVAVEQLIGAVDWVLDPANNRIIYHEPVEFPPTPFIWSAKVGSKTIKGNNPDLVCRQGVSSLAPLKGQDTTYTFISSVRESDTRYSCTYQWERTKPNISSGTDGFYADRVAANPDYNPKDQSEEKYLPLPVVAERVISNAESETDAQKKAGAQVATTAAAADIVAEAETDNTKARPIVSQAEANATTKPADAAEAEKANEATGTSQPNTANPEATDIALEFPVFCNWAPTVCEAAQTVISFPQTLTNWWDTANEKANEWATSISEAWTKVKEEYADKPEENTDTELDIPDQSPPDINTDISFGGSCPASRSVPVSFAGISTEIEFSFQWFCEVASIAKPVVISISAFAAALIVAGVRTEDD